MVWHQVISPDMDSEMHTPGLLMRQLGPSASEFRAVKGCKAFRSCQLECQTVYLMHPQ